MFFKNKKKNEKWTRKRHQQLGPDESDSEESKNESAPNQDSKARMDDEHSELSDLFYSDDESYNSSGEKLKKRKKFIHSRRHL